MALGVQDHVRSSGNCALTCSWLCFCWSSVKLTSTIGQCFPEMESTTPTSLFGTPLLTVKTQPSGNSTFRRSKAVPPCNGVVVSGFQKPTKHLDELDNDISDLRRARS